MDMQKEREAFEDWYCKNHTGLKQSDLAKFRTLSDYSFSDSLKINISWEAWQAAQAIPDGFALVSQKELLELTIAINAVDLATHTESKTNEVRKMWQQVALKLMALGTAQEQSHD